jgi:hypothetical protein
MNATPKFHRPSRIDRWLSKHPHHQEAVARLMLDRGLSVDDVLGGLNAIGCQTSRSAVARHRLLFYRDRSGPKLGSRIELMQILAKLPDDRIGLAITEVVKLLPSP